MTIDSKRFILPPSQYVAEVQKKDLVMLHFTAGSSAVGAFSQFASTPERVATPYIVDRDGSVYELFPAEMWAWHLGQQDMNPGYRNDKRSVAIEIVNVGPLKRQGDQLMWWPNSFGTYWCSMLETDKYRFSERSHRGFSYYAAFPESQFVAVCRLVKSLCLRFQIPAVVPPAEKRTAYDPMWFGKWSGIASHQNFRSDKSDIGPAWDWERFQREIA